MADTTHLAFSDESSHNLGRYRGLGMLSLSAKHTLSLVEILANALEKSSVRELKWQKVKTARDRFAAQKVIDICLEDAMNKNIRIDVLVWDTQDSRHAIQGRDDNANLQRMYFQLFKNVLKIRWPADSTWQLFPDANSILNWSSLEFYLQRRSTSLGSTNMFQPELLGLQNDFDILEISEVDSINTVLAQVADLFVGLSVFSYECFDTYRVWKLQNSPQLDFGFFREEKDREFTSKECEHCTVLSYFEKQMDGLGLNISLESTNGLRTWKPATTPLNFWLYQPQRQNDKAPVRVKSMKKGKRIKKTQ